EIVDDNNEESSETEKVKFYYFPIDKYKEWIKRFEKASLSYY
ncbi:24966_t:CDS:1, partial [Cetraspora pellucida]